MSEADAWGDELAEAIEAAIDALEQLGDKIPPAEARLKRNLELAVAEWKAARTEQ